MTSKLQAMTALAAFATLFYVGCGDDDSNETPNKGGATSTNGGKTGSGGATGTNGGATTTSGGKATTSGGAVNAGGASAGAGGEPVVSPEGGTGGVPIIAPEGGSGGGGGVPGDVQPVLCTAANLDATLKCYADCTPTQTTKSEQFLNHCAGTGVECTPFDNSTLTKLGANGELPALP